MDRLRCLEIIVEVARGGSFTAAAQRFAISRSAVSKHVARLEQTLGAQVLAVRVRGGLCSNLGEALQQAALAGRGLAIHPTYMVAADLAAGRLVNVLPQTPPTGLDIYVVYPARDNQPKRVRAFLDCLRDWARSPPDWSLPSTTMIDLHAQR